MPPTRPTFPTLDCLRGAAALLIVYHHQRTIGMSNAPAGAYLAVDLFFLISGFVLAHAYQQRLLDGLEPLAFMRRRLIRLYPLYLLGIAVGLTVFLAFGRMTPAHPANAVEFVRAVVFALFMAPTLTSDPSVLAFPLNPPSWSLFFELFINLVWATLALRLSTRKLMLVCAGSALALAVWAWRTGGLNLGFQTFSFAAGVPRVAFSFFFGVVIYRLHAAGKLPRLKLHPLWAVIGAVALLTFPPSGQFAWLWALLLVTVAFPALLVIGACSREPRGKLATVFSLSGRASYPLYAIHEPLVIGLLMAAKFWAWPVAVWEPTIGMVFPLALALVSIWIAKAYDAPMARWLSGLRLPVRSAEALA